MHRNDLEYCQGTVERISFYSEASGFCVLRIKARGQRELVTVTGKAASINAGEYIECGGNWVNDKKFGLQFKALWLKAIQPNTVEGIEKYLGSGLIKGIGPVFAKKLVQGFGAEIFAIIDTEPNKLLQLDGIGPKRVAQISSAWVEQKAVREIMVFLQSHGLGTARAVRIYKTYKADAIRLIKENPYRLADEIHGVGFKTADQLAESLGVEKQSPQRASAGILYVLEGFSAEGHCAVPEAVLLKKASQLLEIDPVIIARALQAEIRMSRVIADTIEGEVCLYLDKLYYTEVGLAKHIVRLHKGAPIWAEIDVAKALDWIKTRLNINLSPSQAQAVALALSHKITCITGGPGVGKTTVINSIIKVLLQKKLKLCLCAPTGRAAKRLSISTGLNASTIHRLLEFDPKTYRFKRNEVSALEADLLVLDEASMVDVNLMHSLLSALPNHAALLIVGDVDQLPSVGPGAVLAALINSKIIATARLTEIFRQAQHSQIIVNAHRINQGLLPEPVPPGLSSDFYTIYADTPEQIQQKLNKIMLERLPKAYKVNPITEVQVLSPMNRGALGVKALNLELQKWLNPNPSASVTKFGWTFSIGDKLIQSVNNYDKEVFNGDLGLVASINHDEAVLKLDFEGREVAYDFNELDELDLAYATSIHKAQGSEYPVVIIPLAMQHYSMLQRNLLYTGVTRGKKLVILLGEAKAIAIAVKNNKQTQRITKLALRIIEAQT